MIPAEAVEAAALILHTFGGLSVPEARERARTVLEAAAPHMLADLRSEIVKLAKEFDAAQGGTLAYTATTDDGRFVMRKNAHDQLMYIVDNHMRPTP